MRGIGALGATAAGAGLASDAAEAVGSSAVYQYYHTDWTDVTDDLATIAEQGYDAIQVPPAQYSRLDRSHQEGVTDPPLGYQPVDLRNFDSVFGTEAEYQAMVEEAHVQGLDVIADAVVNHMAAADDFRGADPVTFEELPYFSEADFHPKDDINYDDPESVENDWLTGELKDLKQESSYVRDQLRRYVEKYAGLGVDGIRWDAVKHVPEWFFADYANQWADDNGLWTVGECLQGSVDYCQGYADTGMSVTDYPLYYTLKDACDPNGDLSLLDGAGLVDQSPFRALTFVSNHDSGPPALEKLAYAYVLTYEGYPRVYGNRIAIDDSDIRNLLWIRNNLAGDAAYTRYSASDLYVFERYNNLLVGLNRTSDTRTATVYTSWSNTTLNDYSGNAGDVTTGSDGYVDVSVPPEGWVCYAPY
ncbi:alpha-amylase domain-containing protein [Halomicrobium salinisoli]|uniref:alpha-amylase domain-containing protein n=1 Tax=Halomicrobium salinisoli TaxID=2878391 RepID=UPI001CF038BF|nr:alpha-amylase domain-containing protein [Halomicrobium salinisoli]